MHSQVIKIENYGLQGCYGLNKLALMDTQMAMLPRMQSVMLSLAQQD
jgi:hypothetical protein